MGYLGLRSCLFLAHEAVDLAKETINAIEDGVRRSVALHVGWARYDIVTPVRAHTIDIHLLHVCSERGSCINGTSVWKVISTPTQSELYSFVSEYLRCDDRRDTSEPYNFLLFVKVAQDSLNVLLHSHFCTLEAERAEVLRSAEAARNQKSIVVLSVKICHIFDVSTGNSGRLFHHVPLNGLLISRQMVYNVGLRAIRGIDLHIGAQTREANEHGNRLSRLSSIIDAVSVEDYRSSEITLRWTGYRS